MSVGSAIQLSDSPTFSVIVCTRNRKDNIAPTVRTILAQDYRRFELLIIDQSDNDLTQKTVERIIAELPDETRIQYFRLPLPGKPRALNFGLARARGDYIALTDDDCECKSDWLTQIECGFANNPQIGAVFGQVSAAEHDPAQFYVAVNRFDKARTLRRVTELGRGPETGDFGLGANMAVRRDAAASVGGWDPCIGPGTKFGSGDDHDLTARLLLKGYAVHFRPESEVVHFGFRRWADVGGDQERVGGGFGSAFVKYLRCGVVYPTPLRFFGRFAHRFLARLFLPDKGGRFLRGWLRGFLRALPHPVDKKARQFLPVNAGESRRYGGNFAPVVLRNAAMPVSVLLCTAGRGDSLTTTIASLLAAEGISRLDELLIIDQSADDRTARAVADFAGDARLRYVRTTTRGKGFALNIGLGMARNEIIAITDDDVDVAPDWLAGHLEAFQRYPRVAVTYGQVIAVPFDETAGFIPDYVLEEDRHVTSLSGKVKARGIGANTALRRDVVRSLGGFDVQFGPGGPFPSCDDADMTFRALINGHEIYETRQSRVYHRGFRSWEQGKAFSRGSWFAIGAACAKPLRCGYWGALPVAAHEFFRCALWPFIENIRRLKPRGWQAVKWFVLGFIAGWRIPIDRTTLLFRRKPGAEEIGLKAETTGS